MAISAKVVKELRDKTNAGMMDCKKALEEAGGEMEKAIEILREKGIAKAAKKSERATEEGVIYAYIHPGDKLGVLVEINCETDFVAKTDDFKAFVKDVAMQVAAANPLVVQREEVDPELIEKERQIYRTQALNEGKPEKIVDKIIDGKIEKYYKEICLMEQPFIRDQDKSITDLQNETIATLGENITIKRFCRYRLGE
ncbi:MAG: translation elongation factor Ts [candidate division Zixibacteria bacterium]|nr:translation elongation factor Ts [candidate division Zixibacteria bacterium]